MALHETAQQHFDKLTRVFARLRDEIHKDDLDDFFKTAYHLLENVEKDPSATAPQKAAVSALRSDADMELCREITNKSKHYTLNPRSHPSPKIKKATTEQGFGAGRWGHGGFGVGEQSVTLSLTDGATRDAFNLVESIYAKYKAIL